jgi:ComF family protein
MGGTDPGQGGAGRPRTAATGYHPLAFVRERALDLLFPPRCVSCRSFGGFFCQRCRPLLSEASPPRCLTCWRQSEDDRCPACRYRRPAFAAARAAYCYEGPARDAVHALKYYGVTAIARLMAVPMAERLLQWAPPVSAIVPVPLTAARLRSRGYNQSAMLARELSRLTGVAAGERALVRRGASVPQVRQPDEESRRAGVRGAFAPGRRRLSGGVLLVDDVITTGATLDACARALVDAGSGPAFALTFARED